MLHAAAHLERTLGTSRARVEKTKYKKKSKSVTFRLRCVAVVVRGPSGRSDGVIGA